MTRRAYLLSLLAGGTLLCLFSACTSVLGDFEVADGITNPTEAGTTGEGSVGKKGNGETCAGAGECGSGNCADGVCCESACDGTCEACNLATKGKCLPIPDGQDPANECVGEPLPPAPDAGTPAPVDGGEADGESDAGTASVDLPDGGLIASGGGECAGKCNGNRECKFPNKETACGTQFCNSRIESGGLRCDGKGRCDLAFEECGGYSCRQGKCNTACNQVSDCANSHFCKEGKCVPRNGLGVGCNIGNECLSGFCSDNVCCNTDCGLLPQGNCKKPGLEGRCQCGITCATSCRFFYKDGDNDKHGDMNASPGNPESVRAGCTGDAPPAGYVESNDDCNDREPRAFPGQTEFFDTPAIGTGGYDFNCDKLETKQTKEYPGASCQFCKPPVADEKYACTQTSPSACYYKNQPATLTCRLTKNTRCTVLGGGPCYSCDGTGSLLGSQLDKGFTEEVDCGAKGTFTDCGSCSVAGGPATAPVDTTNYAQKCR